MCTKLVGIKIKERLNMAKFVKSYENGIEKYELTFRGEVYDFSMIPCDFGAKGDKPGFDVQVSKKYLELADEEDLLELLDQLSYDDFDILDTLEQLECWE